MSSLGSNAGDTSPKNRIWLDRMPEKPDEHRNLLLFLEQEDDAAAKDDDGIGIFQRASSFEGDFEIFSFREIGTERYEITMLQKNKKHRVVVRASKCTEKGFDLCLDVDGAPRGPGRYYSKRGWEIGGSESVSEVLERARRVVAEP